MLGHNSDVHYMHICTKVSIQLVIVEVEKSSFAAFDCSLKTDQKHGGVLSEGRV
ncbi:hypothetical protein IC582_008470 [Cucumis melo]